MCPSWKSRAQVGRRVRAGPTQIGANQIGNGLVNQLGDDFNFLVPRGAGNIDGSE